MAGRPRIEFDLEQIEQLAALQCTHEEMAAVLRCSADTIGNRLKEDTDFSEAYKRGKEAGKASLKRMQWKAAQGGNITMMIWLGKQYLGQSDKSEFHGEVGQPMLQIILPGEDSGAGGENDSRQ